MNSVKTVRSIIHASNCRLLMQFLLVTRKAHGLLIKCRRELSNFVLKPTISTNSHKNRLLLASLANCWKKRRHPVFTIMC